MSLDRDRLVVSVHDVCPRTWAACRRIVTALETLGIHRRSLLVIPAEPAGTTAEYPDFVRWLRHRAGDGDEIVLHGYYHGQASADLTGAGRRRPRPDRLTRLLDAALARGAGEFLHLGYAEALARLTAGRDSLRRCGFDPLGFVAPAWLYSPAAAVAVRDAGLRYLTTHLRLRDLRTGHDTWSFGTSNRPGAWTWDYLGRLVNEGFCLAHRPARLVRIGIHPADLEHGQPFRHTLSLLRRLLASGRRPMTYLDCLAP